MQLNNPVYFEVVSRVGIGPVLLGMTRQEVREVMRAHGGLSHERSGFDYFLDDNSLAVEYNDERASFIGASSAPVYAFTYLGLNPFDIPAEALFALIASRERGQHAFNSDEYVFPDQIVTLYEADEQYDYAGGHQRKVYGQIGVGGEAYLAAVRG